MRCTRGHEGTSIEVCSLTPQGRRRISPA
jgi:hypothetical protein